MIKWQVEIFNGYMWVSFGRPFKKEEDAQHLAKRFREAGERIRILMVEE